MVVIGDAHSCQARDREPRAVYSIDVSCWAAMARGRASRTAGRGRSLERSRSKSRRRIVVSMCRPELAEALLVAVRDPVAGRTLPMRALRRAGYAVV